MFVLLIDENTTDAVCSINRGRNFWVDRLAVWEETTTRIK